MGTSAAVRGTEFTRLEGPYIAAADIPPFAICGPPNSSNVVAVVTSGAGYLPSAHVDTVLSGEEFFLADIEGFIVAAGNIAIGQSIVATTAGEGVATTTGVSKIECRNDGSALSGYTDGMIVPVRITSKALVAAP